MTRSRHRSCPARRTCAGGVTVRRARRWQQQRLHVALLHRNELVLQFSERDFVVIVEVVLVEHCFLSLVFVFAQAAEHAAAEATAVAADNARAAPVFISGATGINAAGINGPFDPTQEKGLDGRVLYAKRGDKSMCMEHFGGTWMVKLVSDKGTGNCTAHVAGGCGAEACTSRQWMVTFDSKTFAEAPLVKIVAEAEVCSCRMPSCAILTVHLPPPAFPQTDA